jgi:hypothetical protein
MKGGEGGDRPPSGLLRCPRRPFMPLACRRPQRNLGENAVRATGPEGWNSRRRSGEPGRPNGGGSTGQGRPESGR